MRSRSFFFLPILYLVMATIVVMTTVLSGVPTALIIGCTGLLLLSLGILALVTRDRLIKVSERVSERFNIW
jgi:cadmium resistance protein CadD (predicted permease)